MSSISLEAVSKVYPNGFEAVHELDLHVADGELMVVVGPSGCGKTSVLRMIAGLEAISSGTVTIGDRVVNDVSPRDRDIAMVFQNYALYPQMSVAENIGFGLRMRKQSKREVDATVKEVAQTLGLSEVLKSRPGQLSGGQRQRVAMGRAIVREPSAFLMDEPLSNLDAKLRVQMRAEVARVQRRIGVAAVYVTHDQTEAMTLGHRVAVMRRGVLQQCDAPQVLYDRPANTFVAGFIGSPAMNLLEGAFTGDLGELRLGSQQLALPASVRETRPGLARYRDRTIVVGIRPEDLPAANGGAATLLYGDVDLVEALGSEQLVHFRTDAKPVRAEAAESVEGDLTRIDDDVNVARVDPRQVIRAGERVPFAVAPERVEFFDPDTGLAVWN
jgi:multiple sugar transport system ATP-binding protein